MTVERLSIGTLSVTDLGWHGDGFAEPVADRMWAELPDALRRIAREEIALGNEPWNILRNSLEGIVLLAFRQPPVGEHDPGPEIRIHRGFELGNYCYDGTDCTYEHLPSGCFLAFDRSGGEEEA
jgi:hypothetical protein